jgi:hypothetical protein
MKTLHQPFHFHGHGESHLLRRLKTLAEDYRAQSILTTWILIAMFIILLLMALQAE